MSINMKDVDTVIKMVSILTEAYPYRVTTARELLRTVGELAKLATDIPEDQTLITDAAVDKILKYSRK